MAFAKLKIPYEMHKNQKIMQSLKHYFDLFNMIDQDIEEKYFVYQVNKSNKFNVKEFVNVDFKGTKVTNCYYPNNE